MGESKNINEETEDECKSKRSETLVSHCFYIIFKYYIETNCHFPGHWIFPWDLSLSTSIKMGYLVSTGYILGRMY
jgi:hypothetical protein